MKYRLSLDMGSTSLGWCVLALDGKNAPTSLINLGSRIFSDGRDDKTKEPLAVARRKARAIRRNLDRRDRRQRRLMAILIQHGLMPQEPNNRKDLEQLDPYELRAKGLDQKLSLHELGRALFHINQRRGFKSNRKTDKRENDASNMKNAIKDLDGKLFSSNSRTLGEYLWTQHKIQQPVRVRSQIVKNKAEYNFYPSRDMYVKEIDLLLSKQQSFHPELTAELCEEIKDVIFFQRQLKAPTVGNCRFENKEKRARLAYPIVQKFRILQEVNNLQIERLAETDPMLTPDNRNTVIAALLASKKKTFGQIRTLLKLTRDCRFNLESDNRTELNGDTTSALLSENKCFGAAWHDFSQTEQEHIVDLILETQDPDTLVETLATTYGVSAEQAEEIANAPITEGYGSVSKKAIEKMLPHLEQGLKYSVAVRAAGYAHHSDFRTGEFFDRLPYYGEVLQNNVIGGTYSEEDKDIPEKYYGKINNPSVHIALNQVRKLVNALIDVYGHPDEVVIELARDLKEPADEIAKDQAKNTKDNKRINEELTKLGVKQNYRNRMLFKLWEDLAEDPVKRCCPFSGKPIAMHDIYTGEFEEEHLLPFSRSYNDGRANKVLSSLEANRLKRNRTPFEAFAHTPEWPDILARIQNLPKNKRWRFQEDAWDIAKGEGEDVIARMLNDTRYMSKITKAYLSAIFDNEKGRSKVWTIPGQMTALLRDKWGLNNLLGEEDDQKDRSDHRHHAIDAFVIGCSDRGTFQRLSAAAKRLEEDESLYDKRRKLVSKMPEPFDGALAQVSEKISKTIVSHKPDHGNAAKAISAESPYTTGQLHKATTFGLIGTAEKKGHVIVATRAPIESLETMKDVEKVGDQTIRGHLKSTLSDIKEKSTEWKAALQKFTQDTGTRRVRLHIEKTADVLIGIKQPTDRGDESTRGRTYKFYEFGNNYCAEIFCPDKGKKAGQWQCEIIPNYYAHQKDFIPQWRRDNPTAKLIMRLQKDDMVAYEEKGQEYICRVKKMSSGLVFFRSHQIAKENGNELSRKMSGAQMQEFNVRKISVDIIGRIKDPKKGSHSQEAAA